MNGIDSLFQFYAYVVDKTAFGLQGLGLVWCLKSMHRWV